MFYFEEIDGKKILKSDLITKAQAFFTTKDSFLKTQDEKYLEQTENNKEILAKYLKINKIKFISPIQTHSANIEFVKETKSSYPDTDSLILTNTSQALFLNFADCTPIIIYDENQNIGAVTHAGWRGTAQKIAPLTVKKMVKECNSSLSDIKVLIGPAISMCCYDVGQEVFENLKSTVKDFSGLFKNENGKLYVDLKNINRKQLEEIGVKKIDVCPYCTVCNNEYFFSYRKENKTTNRHNAVLKLYE